MENLAYVREDLEIIGDKRNYDKVHKSSFFVTLVLRFREANSSCTIPGKIKFKGGHNCCLI